MARLTGALFSLAASGTIADTLTFAKWNGIQYVRTRVIPANPKSAAQQEVRGVFSTLTEMWKRMPSGARTPFIYAVRGLPMTARNKHIQVNVKALIDETTLDELVMSVSTGSAIPPAAVASAEAPAGSVELTITPPTPPSGYAIHSYRAACVQDGDPSPVLIRTTFYNTVVAPGLVVSVAVDPASVTYQWGCWVVYRRLSDSMYFESAAIRGTQAIA